MIQSFRFGLNVQKFLIFENEFRKIVLFSHCFLQLLFFFKVFTQISNINPGPTLKLGFNKKKQFQWTKRISTKRMAMTQCLFFDNVVRQNGVNLVLDNQKIPGCQIFTMSMHGIWKVFLNLNEEPAPFNNLACCGNTN